MFERRLKIFLGILIGVTVILLFRAAHLQLANGDYWRMQASQTLHRQTLVEPIRGKIVDFRDRTLAEDVACIDAAVDYRAIDLDDKWLTEQALSRLNARLGLNYRRAEKDARKKMLEDEVKRVKADIANMWLTLAQISGKPLEEIEEIRSNIRLRVEMRQRYLWYNKYKQAVKKEDQAKAVPWYKDWRLGAKSNSDLDNFNIAVSEETEAHVIVSNISTETHNQLKKRIEQFPGLVLRPSKHRWYPYGEVACHVIGHMTSVDKTDMENNPNQQNELLQYLPNDRIGRSGVEALCELTLRGQRGRIERLLGHDEIYSQLEPQQGKTVKLTIDIALQNEIENVFKDVTWREQGVIVEEHAMHGAAIVIDVPTGEVRALASYPTYDLNHFDEIYKELATNYIDNPLLNRATQTAYEPGSTVKPIVGAAAVTEGVVTLQSGIECTGYLVIDGHVQKHGRCWTASNYAKDHPELVAHHQLGGARHLTGFLNLTDALERSCNVYFETVGDQLGIDRLSHWYSQFGLGSKTEIGLAEATGRIPSQFEGPRFPAVIRQTTWFASIGQGQVLATPIQMANVAATVARNGVWVRPRLVVDANDVARATTRPATKPDRPDRVELPIAKETIAAIQEGMYRVVYGSAGTGIAADKSAAVLCGKTGTAQAMFFSIPRRDANGELLKDAKNNLIRDRQTMSTRENPNPLIPWYRGTSKDTLPHHAWFIGFAPRQNPKIAIAIMLEYGGISHDAAALSKQVIDACIRNNYLAADQTTSPVAASQASPSVQ